MPRRPAIAAFADVHAAPGGVATLDRALSILAAFTPTQSSLELADLAARTRIGKSTLLRMLASLLHAHLVVRDDQGRYALGVAVERLQRVRAATFALDVAVLPALQNLAQATGESASYWVRHGDARLCLFRVDSIHPVREHQRVGDVLPLSRGAPSRVLLAFSGARGAAAVRIRREGYAALVGDRVAEIAGIAAPVFGMDYTLQGAISLSMPATRFATAWVPDVVAAARTLSARLGANQTQPAGCSLP